MTTTTVSVLPLTTTFTPPTACFSDFSAVTDARSQLIPLYYELLSSDNSTCFPSDWTPTSYFSPGICPSGYSIAESSIVNINSLTETHATCCPTSYHVTSSYGVHFLFTSRPCVSNSISYQSYRVPSATSVSVSSMGEDGVFAYPVSIRWRSTDFSSPTPSSSRQSSSDSHVTSTDAAQPATGSGGLATGAKIGIGLGVSLGVLTVIVLALGFFCVRRRKQGEQEPAPKTQNEADSSQIAEKFSSQRFELPASSAPTELPPNEIAELDGNR